MKLKKILTAGIALAMVLGVTACSPNNKTENNTDTKTQTGKDNAVVENDYVQQYSRFYGDYMTGLNNYQMYLTPETTTEYYKTNEYPGNEKYLGEVKTAYKETRDKMQSFVDSLKNDLKTEDVEVKKMNKDLIAEGEKAIKNIDEKIKKLDKLPTEHMNKPQAEFINVVGETTTIKDDMKSNFSNMLEDMNKKLGIDMNK